MDATIPAYFVRLQRKKKNKPITNGNAACMLGNAAYVLLSRPVYCMNERSAKTRWIPGSIHGGELGTMKNITSLRYDAVTIQRRYSRRRCRSNRVTTRPNAR